MDSEGAETTSINSRRPRARKGSGPALRDELIAAAQRVLEETGSAEGVTIRAVATAAGVTPPAVYLHFATRDELAYELAFALFNQHYEPLEQTLTQLVDPLHRIRERGVFYLDFAFKYPELFRILFMSRKVPTRFEGITLIRDTNMAGMTEELKNAMQKGLVEPGDPRVLSCLLWAGVHGLASLLISLDTFPWPPRPYLVDRMLELLRSGYLPRHDFV